MAATFAWSETYGSSPGTTADTSYVHLLASDVASGNSTNFSNYPLAIPGSGTVYSIERWIRGHWTGTFSSISAVKFWKSVGSLLTGRTLNAGAKGNQTYVTPTGGSTSQSSYATSAIPTAVGSALAPAYSSNYCDYIVLQMALASTASPGANGSITYTFQYNES